MPTGTGEIIGEGGRTGKYQGGIELLVILLDVVCIAFGRLPLVHDVEVKAGIIGLGWLKKSSESTLEAAFGQWSAM